METFDEDYQFITRKLGFWNDFDDEHKLVGVSKENESKGMDHLKVLNTLSKENLDKLLKIKGSEMEMFGYQFDPELDDPFIIKPGY